MQDDIQYLQTCVALDRDTRAYKRLFLHFYPRLIAFGAHFLHSREAAEEVYSDVMMKVWQMESSLVRIANLKVYLYTAVRNASINYLEKYNKLKTTSLDEAALCSMGSNATELSLSFSELERQIAAAVSALPPRSQQVFRLIREEGFSYREVSEILGISINTIEGHMTAALRKVQAALAGFAAPEKN